MFVCLFVSLFENDSFLSAGKFLSTSVGRPGVLGENPSEPMQSCLLACQALLSSRLF